MEEGRDQYCPRCDLYLYQVIESLLKSEKSFSTIASHCQSDLTDIRWHAIWCMTNKKAHLHRCTAMNTSTIGRCENFAIEGENLCFQHKKKAQPGMQTASHRPLPVPETVGAYFHALFPFDAAMRIWCLQFWDSFHRLPGPARQEFLEYCQWVLNEWSTILQEIAAARPNAALLPVPERHGVAALPLQHGSPDQDAEAGRKDDEATLVTWTAEQEQYLREHVGDHSLSAIAQTLHLPLAIVLNKVMDWQQDARDGEPVAADPQSSL